jgi:TonB-dependent receptor
MRRLHLSSRYPAPFALCAIAVAVSAHAQTPGTAPAAPGAPAQRVVITGQAEAVDRALRDQEAAANVISVVRVDGIGRLPDKNAAEALQRLPGVSIERDQGEGRYVRIRGLGPDLNAVTINGALVPAPENGRRAVALDVIPSSLVRSLTVTKTLTPDMDANSIGGTVDVQTLSAFDNPGRFVTAEFGLSRESLTRRTSPSASFAWTDRLADGRLGVAFALSHEQRKFGSDNVETGGAWDGDALESFERRDYRILRERTGAALNLEWKPQDGRLFFARALASRFADDEQRQAHVVEFDDAQPAGAVGDAESVRELRDRKETQTIRSLTLGTDLSLGDWRFQAAFGVSDAKEVLPQRIAGAVFEADGAFSGVGFTDGKRPRLVGPAAINTATPYLLQEIEAEATRAVDRERHIRFDLSRSLKLGSVDATLKFGAKSSRRVKTNAQTTWVVEDLGDPPLALSDADRGLTRFARRDVDYSLGNYGPLIESGPLLNLLGRVNLDDFRDDEESTINNVRMEERVDAAFLMSTFQLDATTVIAGLRSERTTLRARGTGIEDGDFVAVDERRRQRHWLPGLHVRHDLDKRSSLRAAITTSVVRPTFEQLSPGFVIDGDEAEFGNPQLQAMKSTNLDLGFERQLGYAGAVSAYAFAKRIRNFVYQTDVAGTGRWADFDEAITFANGDKASVRGAEFAWSRSWRDLPAPWNGLVTSANATFSSSKAVIGANDGGSVVTRTIPLPSQSKRAFNAMVGWESPSFAVRLAANHKSRYLLEVGDPLDTERDLYVDGQTQWDLSLRFAVGARSTLVVEALNLTDEPYYTFQARPSRNAQFETYGRTIRVGLKLVLF